MYTCSYNSFDLLKVIIVFYKMYYFYKEEKCSHEVSDQL